MVQPSASPEYFSPPLKQLPCRTHLTMSPTSKLICSLFDQLYPALFSGTATSLMGCQQPHMFSSNMMLYANHCNRHTMDRSQSSKEQTNISLSTSMVVRTLSPSIGSSPLISIPTKYIPSHKRHLCPFQHVEQHDLGDTSVSLSISPNTCCKTLRGSGLVN